jgi:hypothetical protein
MAVTALADIAAAPVTFARRGNPDAESLAAVCSGPTAEASLQAGGRRFAGYGPPLPVRLRTSEGRCALQRPHGFGSNGHLSAKSAWSKKAITRCSYSAGLVSMPRVCSAPRTIQIVFGCPAAA